MTTTEFVEIIGEIEKFYEKEYTATQRKYIFEELKNITKARFRQVARETYRTCKFMPKLADLVDVERALPREVIIKNSERSECKRCKRIRINSIQKTDKHRNEKIRICVCSKM